MAGPPPTLRHLLNVHSFFTFGGGASSPRRLVERAADLGYESVALTDVNGVYGAVELHRAARERGLHAIVGATVRLKLGDEVFPLPLLTRSRRGYARLGELLTVAHQQGGTVTLPMLEAHAEDLHALTGGRRGFPSRYLAARRFRELNRTLDRLRAAFPQRLHLQLYFDRHPADRQRARYLRKVAMERRLPAVAAPEVRYATPDLYPLFDALVCAREGITVEEPHPLRPQNDAHAVPRPDLSDLSPLPDPPLLRPDVLAATEALAEDCAWALLPDRLQPPEPRLPDGVSAEQHLEQRAYGALLERYRGEALGRAKARLEEELATVRALGFAGFFLAAAEVTDFCHARGIVASGRGSAAASIVCYLLGITQADPLAHDLLFERFLHGGKASPPDIDIDIASGRRDEVLAWVEERFGARTQAMVCNRITYHLPLAVQDLGRALGLPAELRNRLSRGLGRDHRHRRPHRAREAQEAFDEFLGDAPAKEALLRLLEMVEPHFVRHVAPHSGGVVLSREPLTHYSPLERSTGGITLLQFDKDDAEALGLVKLDLLGLRMLGVVERTREEVYRTEGRWLEVREPPLEDAVWDEIGEGDTMGLFQIESPGQVRMSVQLQPRTLTDLAHQVALFRPGPLQSQTVHPYIARRRGRERVRFPHPSLEPILGKTYGVLLFQEDVMRMAVHVAGMDWSDAERFRKRVADFEEEDEIRAWRDAFLEGAQRFAGCTLAQAREIFGMLAVFRGYGFAESHAWAFGLHAYISAWLRHHYPNEYLAAVLTEHPGMWSRGTLRQEAKRWGVRFAKLDVNRSGLHYRVEGRGERKRVRPPLSAAHGVSEEAAREVLFERARGGAYRDLRDLFERVTVGADTLEALARAGAFDRLQERRAAAFDARALHHAQPPGRTPLFALAPEPPPLEALDFQGTVVHDFETKGFHERGVHPVDLMRHQLLELGATPMARLRPGEVRTGGLIVAKQKPPTAHGFAFLVVEDGPLRIQVVISPALWEAETRTLRDAHLLVADGVFERHGRAWTLRARAVLGLRGPVRGEGYHYA